MARRLIQDRPELVAHDVVTRAMHRTGGDDFDGTAWIEPLEVLTRSLDREAGLSRTARRAARAQLVDRLSQRAPTVARPPIDTSPPVRASGPTVVVVGLDPMLVGALESALGAEAGRGLRLLDGAFSSQRDEWQWHVPSFSEWLAEADFVPICHDVARRSRATSPATSVDVVAAGQLVEQLPAVRIAWPDAVIVEIHTDPGSAARVVTDLSIERRRSNGIDVDEAKVGRYWRWRLDLSAERRAAWVPIGPTLDVDGAEVAADAAAVAARVQSIIGAPGKSSGDS